MILIITKDIVRRRLSDVNRGDMENRHTGLQTTVIQKAQLVCFCSFRSILPVVQAFMFALPCIIVCIDVSSYDGSGHKF